MKEVVRMPVERRKDDAAKRRAEVRAGGATGAGMVSVLLGGEGEREKSGSTR
jgi:hypothetical protein